MANSSSNRASLDRAPWLRAAISGISVFSLAVLFAIVVATPGRSFADSDVYNGLKANPTKLSFGDATVGIASPSQTDTATNQYDDDTIQFTGFFNPSIFVTAGYTITNNTCGSTLNALQSCHVDVACNPTRTGFLFGVLAFFYTSDEITPPNDLWDGYPMATFVGLTCTGVIGATPTPTATATATLTSTPTPTVTATQTMTATPTVTATSGTPTRSATGTPSPTPSPFGTPSRTRTPTATATATLTVTATPTMSASPTLSSTPTITPTPKPMLSGHVMGGLNSVSGSAVEMWAAGTSGGYGTGAVEFGTTSSAADGSFSLEGICPGGAGGGSAQVYLTAQGGNAGGGANGNLMMIAAVGPCDEIFGFHNTVIINEVSTAGAVYSLAQFLSTTSSGTVGAPSTNFTGLVNAFTNVTNLVDLASGAALTTTPGGGTSPQKNLNSIANALAACVQTNGAASAPCTELFDCALPGAVFSAGACTGGTGSVADTLAAALSIALNPSSVSVAGINDVAGKAAVFSPALLSAPNDWSMPLNFAPPGSNFSNPSGVAIDASGNVWVANDVGNSVTELTASGGFAGNFNDANTIGANLNAPIGVAIDGAGKVWVTNQGGGPNGTGSVTVLTSSGGLVGDFDPVGANFEGPSSLAIDGSGNVWIADFDGDILTELASGGGLVGNFAPTGANFGHPSSVAIDAGGNAWVVNRANGSVTELGPSGSLVANFNNSNTSGANFDQVFDLAIDAAGNVWVSNSGGNSVTELTSNGGLVGNFSPSGGNLNVPSAIAIDGAGSAWVTNEHGGPGNTGSVTELTSSGGLAGNLAPAGSGLNTPFVVAIDASGNLWVPNSFDNSLTELVGAAKPVLTPLGACLNKMPPHPVCLP